MASEEKALFGLDKYEYRIVVADGNVTLEEEVTRLRKQGWSFVPGTQLVLDDICVQGRWIREMERGVPRI
jgi:hypothetical protein